MLGSGDQISSGELFSRQNAAIVLPGSLFQHISMLSNVGAVFGIYDNTNLFPVGENLAAPAAVDGNATKLTMTGSQILSATVGNDGAKLVNLPDPVSVTLRLNTNNTVSEYKHKPSIVFPFFSVQH